MGVDYSVYLGPYIEIERGTTRMVKFNITTCININCTEHQNPALGNFCKVCGSKVGVVETEDEDEICSHELWEEHEILRKQLFPEESYDDSVDIWIPQIETKRKKGWSLKYNKCFQDMTDINPKDEIEMVKKQCKESLDIITQAYGKEPVIKWGIMGGCS
jgi:hypothetical protein